MDCSQSGEDGAGRQAMHQVVLRVVQGLRYWVRQPLVVRDAAVAAEATVGLSGASSR